VGEDSLFEESGNSGYGNGDITLYMVLTGLDLVALRLNGDQTLLADSFSAADGIENNASLFCGIKEGCAGGNRNLPSVGLKGYAEMFHFGIISR
jgi:hypothetical protein